MSNITEATNPDKKQRFSVYVPSPAASFQLGAADYKNGFGYNGGALSVDPCLFIDVNKHTLYQSGTHSCWQVGGKWLQYANGPMYMTSLEHTTVGAGLKMLVVAGAAQGQITALVHRKDGTPRIVEYNNLTTRYRVEEQANNVVRFLHARKTVKDYGDTDGVAVDGPPHMKAGMVAVSKATTQALALLPDPLDQMEDEKGRAHFRTFYPYAKKSKLPILKQLYWLLNNMYRLRDVLQKYLWFITDNALVATATKILESVNHVFNTYDNVSKFLTNAVLDFASKNNPDTGEREWSWEDNRFAREATGADGQGWGARIKYVQGTVQKLYAKVTSGSGPFDFTQKRSYQDLTVEYDSGSTVFSANNLPRSATVTGTAPLAVDGQTWSAAQAVTMPSAGTTLTITVGASTVTVDFKADEEVTCAQMASKIGGADATGKLTAVDKNGVLYLYAKDGATAVSTSWTVDPSPTFAAAKILPGLGGQSFLLTVDHVVSVVTFAATDLLIEDVVARINNATGHTSPAVATVVGGAVKLESIRSGAKRANLGIVEQSAGVLARIGLSPTQVVGTNGNAAVADWEAVTAQEVHDHIATSGKDKIAVDGDSFKLKSSRGGADSEVKEIPSNNTSTVLGLAGKKDKIDGDDFWLGTPGDLIQDMRATVFELNKLPEDTRNLARPLIEAIDNANGTVASAAGFFDSLASIKELWVPGASPPSPVSIVGKDGISLGTNDTLVGVASKGVCFYATGAAGVVDTREFIFGPFEKALSNAPFWLGSSLTELDPKDAYESNVGFQVRSAAGISMRSVHRAELVAVGRTDAGVGVGHALVGGSSTAEVCAEKTAAIGARAEGGRVEVLGERISIGEPRAKLAGTEIKSTWDPTQTKNQVVTADIQAEAKAIASIGAGGYFMCFTARDANPALTARKLVLTQEKADKTQAAVAVQAQITQHELSIAALTTATVRLIAKNPDKDPEDIQKVLDNRKQRQKLQSEVTRLKHYKTALKTRATEIQKEMDQLQALIDKGTPGVLIALRDPAEERVPKKDVPSFSLKEAGITLVTSTQKHGDPEQGTKIDMSDDQVVITQGDEDYGFAVSNEGIAMKIGKKEKLLEFKKNGVKLAKATKVDFGLANKILLG